MFPQSFHRISGGLLTPFWQENLHLAGSWRWYIGDGVQGKTSEEFHSILKRTPISRFSRKTMENRSQLNSTFGPKGALWITARRSKRYQEITKQMENNAFFYFTVALDDWTVTTSEVSQVASCGGVTRMRLRETGRNPIWLVVGPPLWKIWTSIGMMRFRIYGKIKLMFQTTNQPSILPLFWKLGLEFQRLLRELETEMVGLEAEVSARHGSIVKGVLSSSFWTNVYWTPNDTMNQESFDDWDQEYLYRV